MGDLVILRDDDTHLSTTVMGLPGLEGETVFLRVFIAHGIHWLWVWVISTSVCTALCDWEGGDG